MGKDLNLWNKAKKALSDDKYISPLVKRYGPCEIAIAPRSKYFEKLSRAIVGQQLSIKAAATIYKRFEKTVGKINPENILKISDNELRACGLSRAKTEYIKDLALRVKKGELEIEKLDKLPKEKVMEELVAVKGIGVWTAEMFLMFSLGSPDIFPVSDLGIRKGMVIVTKTEMTNEEMVKFAERWKPWRTFASYYLWKVLDNK